MSTTIIMHFLNKIKQSKAETDENRIKFLRNRLHNYGTMVSSINELKYLRGLDSGEKLDPREKIRATAGRVGLSVPKVIEFIFFINYNFLNCLSLIMMYYYSFFVLMISHSCLYCCRLTYQFHTDNINKFCVTYNQTSSLMK